ncbi:hypothetical protein ABW21_db0204790 [Orbilia brochopaga]|nr:hypothetical protein ABW21_db0204790 [Drechslerella brochopaga]
MPAFPSANVNAWTPGPTAPDHGVRGHGETLTPRSDTRHQVPLAGQQYGGPTPGISTPHTSTANSSSSAMGRPQLQFVPDSANHDTSSPVAIDTIRQDASLQDTSINATIPNATTNEPLYRHDPEHTMMTPFPPMQFTSVWSRPGVGTAGALTHFQSVVPAYSSETIPSSHLAQLTSALPAPNLAYELQTGTPRKAVELSSFPDNPSLQSPYPTYTANSMNYNQSNTFPLPDGTPAPSLSSQQPQYWVVQPSLKHNGFLRGPLRPETDQMLPKLQVSEPSFPSSVTASSSQASAHFHSAQIRNGADDGGISDLEEMTRLWLVSHIAGYDDALKHVPLEELGKQVVMIGGPSFAPPGNGHSWNIVKIENIPYNLDDDMLFEFLGKNPGLVPEEQGGVHIIMDRTTVRGPLLFTAQDEAF